MIPALATPLALALVGLSREPARGSARVGDLTAAARAALSGEEFAVPQDRSSPIHDRLHAQRALTYVAASSNRKDRYRVLLAVLSRYPSLRSSWSRGAGGRSSPLDSGFLRDELSYYREKMKSVNKAERGWVRAEAKAIVGLIEMS